MFRHLPFLDLFELKFVSKRFHELVNSDISFRRILELTDSMCKQVLWSDKIQKTLSDFKEMLVLKFNDELMLQLYLKHKVSSIFDRFSLCQIFCHFVFCKRCCDQDTVFAQYYRKKKNSIFSNVFLRFPRLHSCFGWIWFVWWNYNW